MTLLQIAIKNIWQNRGRYGAFLASSAFSVMIYFLYTALILHPDLQGGYRYAEYAIEGMRAASVVIVVFTFLFLLYSHSSFVRFRMKEFGLLSLLGVSRCQLVRIVLGESLMVAVVALTAGMGMGLLFLQLFLMAVSALLQLPEQLPFFAGAAVWLRTVEVFSGLFIVVSLASLRSVLRKNIVELVRARRRPKAVPTFSWWKTAIGLVLLLGGYAWASVPNPGVVVFGIIPVTIVVSIGTVILMREGSIAFLTWLHKRDRYFYRPGPFLTVSQLVYKIQDNYRVLAAVAILVAVILTAVGTTFSIYMVATSDTETSFPQAIQLLQPHGASMQPEIGKVNAVLARHGLENMEFHEVVAINGQIEEKGSVAIIPYSFYQPQRAKEDLLELEDESEAILVFPSGYLRGNQNEKEPWQDRIETNGESWVAKVKPDESGRLFNRAFQFCLVVTDDVYADLLKTSTLERQTRVAVWQGKWKSQAMRDAMAELRALSFGGSIQLSMAGEAYLQTMISMGIVLFIGVFVSLVFFAACFSLLYSRLFTDIDEDRNYSRRLQQVGVTTSELRHQALRQAAVIFFVPFLVGLLHSTFAMLALGTLTQRTVLQYGWAVALIYLVLYAASFAGTSRVYWRSLQTGLREAVRSA